MIVVHARPMILQRQRYLHPNSFMASHRTAQLLESHPFRLGDTKSVQADDGHKA